MATEDDVITLADSVSRVVEGAYLSGRFKVSCAPSKTHQQQHEFSVTPVLVDFSRLLQQQKLSRGVGSSDETHSIISGISNKDLLHAIVGLYDTCLSELTPDVLYSTVCGKWARTIVLVRDVKDAFLEFEKRRDTKDNKEDSTSVQTRDNSKKEDDVYHCPEPMASTFSCCYSDSSDTEEDDDSDEEEDCSQGINKFLSQASQRRQARHKHLGPFTLEHVGPENRVVAACTFDKKYIKTGEKIAHLTLLTIRKRFRRLGLGKYLVAQVKDPMVSGAHDAVVVHAESEATSFFERCGFSDDLILNSKWREIAEQFTNCTLLTYTPPYTGQAISNTVTDFDLLALDKDLRKWKDKSIEAYQTQVTVIERMKAEMIRLRSMVTAQDATIQDLRLKLTVMEANHVQTEKELLLYQIKSYNLNDIDECEGDNVDNGSLQQRYQVLSSKLTDVDNSATGQDSPMSTSPNNSLILTDDAEQELKRYVVVSDNAGEVYDHGKDIAEFHRICEDFKTSLKKDVKMLKSYNVTSVSKALPSTNVVNKYARIIRGVGETSMVMKLYYCGSYKHPERLESILRDGFSDSDITDGDYGKGLYFSRYASTAIHFTVPNKVLVAEVALGKCQTVVTKSKGRQSPDDGFNSILCPGRLCAGSGDGSMEQEYVLFDCSQALPLDLIEYSDKSPLVSETSRENGTVSALQT